MKQVYFIMLLLFCAAGYDAHAQWAIGPSVLTARTAPAAVTVNGKIYVIGGFNGPTAHTTNEVFDSVLSSWSTKAPMLTGRGRLAVSVGPGDSIIYAVGGNGAQNTVEAYNINTNSWVSRAPIGQGRLGAIAGFINGKLYVAGGTSFDTVNTLEEYDPVSNTWSFKARMPTPRYLLAGGVIGGKLYAVGGTNSYTGGPALGTVEVYDPVSNTWATKSSMIVPVSNMAATVIFGTLFTAGGFGGLGAGTEFQMYNPGSDSWTVLTSLSCSRGDLAVSNLGNAVYAIAGVDAPGGNVFDTVEIFHVYTLGTEKEIPQGVSHYAYPNPCNTSVNICFDIPGNGSVSLKVFNVNGQEVAMPVNGYLPAGRHDVTLETAYLPAGIYYYRLETNGFTETKKIVVQH